MAQQTIFLGTNPNDRTGESLRGAGGMINSNFTELYALQSDTINAGAVAYSAATNHGRVQLAIDDAVLLGKTRVFVPSRYLPYDASSVTFNTGVQMTREGGNDSVYDVRAYGAIGDDATNDTPAFVGALNGASVAGGASVFVPSGSYRLGATGAFSSVAVLGLSNGCSITGPGGQNKPILTLANGTNRSLLRIPETSQGLLVSNLHFEGNQANQSGTSHGLWLAGDGTYKDSRTTLENVFINDFLTSGVKIDLLTSNIFGRRVIVRSCGSHGWDLACSDSLFLKCEAGSNGGNGFNLTAGFNEFKGGGAYINTLRNVIVTSSATFCSFSRFDFDRAQLDNALIQASNTLIHGCFTRDPSQIGNGLWAHFSVDVNTTGVMIVHNTFKTKSLTNQASFGINLQSSSKGIFGPNIHEATSANTDVNANVAPALTGATPDVRNQEVVTLSQSGATTVTNFTNGCNGQPLEVRATDGNSTIQHNANINLQGGVDFAMGSGAILTLRRISAVWYETARRTA